MAKDSGPRRLSTFVAAALLIFLLLAGYYFFSFIQSNSNLQKEHTHVLWDVKKCAQQRTKCNEKLTMCHNNEALLAKSNRELQQNIAGKENNIAGMDRELDAVRTRLSNAFSFFISVKGILGNSDDLGSIEQEVSPVTVEALKTALLQWKAERLVFQKLNESHIELTKKFGNLATQHDSLKNVTQIISKEYGELKAKHENASKAEDKVKSRVEHLNNSYYMQLSLNKALQRKVNLYKSQLDEMNSTLQQLGDKLDTKETSNAKVTADADIKTSAEDAKPTTATKGGAGNSDKLDSKEILNAKGTADADIKTSAEDANPTIAPKEGVANSLSPTGTPKSNTESIQNEMVTTVKDVLPPIITTLTSNQEPKQDSVKAQVVS